MVHQEDYKDRCENNMITQREEAAIKHQEQQKRNKKKTEEHIEKTQKKRDCTYKMQVAYSQQTGGN